MIASITWLWAFTHDSCKCPEFRKTIKINISFQFVLVQTANISKHETNLIIRLVPFFFRQSRAIVQFVLNFRLTLGMQKRKVLKQKLLRGVYEYKKETIPFVEIYKTL